MQLLFGSLFNLVVADGREFDRLLADGDTFRVGGRDMRVLHTPGHKPADVTCGVGDAAFVGDTMVMRDHGTARADFPGGCARTLYRSIRHVLDMLPETGLFTAHASKAPGRDGFAWESTVAGQRAGNAHVRDGVTEDDYAAMRQARDATLLMPALIIPAVQVNMRGGKLPAP